MEDQNVEFTPEQISRHAQGNLTALLLGTIVYLKEQGIAPEEWALSIGHQFAPGWGQAGERGAREIARLAALNAVSGGSVLQALTGDDNSAEAVISGWPAPEVAEFLHVNPTDADAFLEAFVPISQQVGLRFQWEREGDHIVLKFIR